MYASKYIFEKGFFVAWLVVSIIWVWGTMIVAGFFPIIDGWRQLRQVYIGLRGGAIEGAKEEPSETPQSNSSVFIDSEK